MRNTWKAAETQTNLTCVLEVLILNLFRGTNDFDWEVFFVFLVFLGKMTGALAYVTKICLIMCSWRLQYKVVCGYQHLS
jgi:ascorbate-specific PTS system EIIC-type component UlaA